MRGLDFVGIYAFNANVFKNHFAMSHMIALAAPGTVISVGRGAYRHVGLLTEPIPGHARRVLSLNPGLLGHQVVEEDLTAFARGQKVNLDPVWGSLPGTEVLRRARSGFHPPYSWTQFNCEHFARFAHGLPLESPQLKAWALVGGLAALFFFGTRGTA